MTTNHTPTPWEARTGKAAHACIYVQGTDHDVAIGMRPDDAAHIVRCVNAHDELIAALRMIDTAHADCVRYADAPGSGTDWRSYCLELANIARAALARVQA